MQQRAGHAPDGTRWELSGPEDRPVIVAIHGLGMTMHTWDQHLEELARGHQVLRYDLLGHGDSAHVPDHLSLTSFSSQLIALMDHLEIDTATLVGFSLGGMINRRVAIDHRERVAALAILNSPHERGAEGQRLVEERARASAEGGPEATIDATLQRWFTPAFLKDSPTMVATVRAWVLANDRADYAACRRVLADGVPELIRPDPPLHIPTLVMTCENDSGSTPDMSSTIAREIAGSETVIVPTLQHLGLLEEPALFTNAILDFVARRLPGT
jgi:pimeloyl-ACP methyl ester carboxylesterase